MARKPQNFIVGPLGVSLGCWFILHPLGTTLLAEILPFPFVLAVSSCVSPFQNSRGSIGANACLRCLQD